ncbi:MAG: MATE family efflux transporter [Firmicutes bacterium]|nr:MATE family efflux transporter [Bacillota bacterium]
MDSEKITTAVQENKMGVQPVGKLLAGMAIPIMISMLVQALYNIVDSIFVAQVSENALSAVSLAFPLQNLLLAVGIGTAVGMNALLSRSLGAKKQNEVDRAANTGLFLSIISAIVFAVFGLLGSRAFFMVQTDVEEIVNYGTEYAMICLGCSFGVFIQLYCERLLQATGRTSLSMWTQMIGALINIILDPILIFGMFGLPRMEVAGAAWATVIGQIVAAAAGIFLNIKYNPEIHIKLKMIRWNTSTVKAIYRVGFPSIIMQCIGSVMTFCMNTILIAFSTTATAVFGVYFKLQSFVFMPVFGLNSGMIPIISYNYGAKRMDRVKKTIVLAITVAICIMALGTLAFELLPGVLLSFFNASADMLAIGIPALQIIGSHFLLAGFCIIAGSVCQAIGNPTYSLISSVCRQLVVLLPAAWLLAQTGELNLVWLSFPIAELASLVMNIIFLKKTMKSVEEYL